ncbi:MATE family efflux transporter [Lacticaseibacillus suihuaensis]
MSLVVPKILGVEQFSYWQLFLFYTTYVGFLSLGFNDGLYLTQGGRSVGEAIDDNVGPQIRLNTVLQTVFVIGICLFALRNTSDSSRSMVIILTGVFAVLSNLNADIGYFFQAVNDTKKFSIATMIEKAFFLMFVIAALLLRTSSYLPLAYLYVTAKFISLLYFAYMSRTMLMMPGKSLYDTFQRMLRNMGVGINLMFANIAGMLIIGIGRKLIDIVWGIESFGKFSFALSIENFFLVFICQVSMVLFPALRRATTKQLESFYGTGQKLLGYLLPAIYLSFLPIKLILNIWIPEYSTSFEVLGFLLPLCIFDGKMNLLSMTYLKVLRKEKILLKINLETVALSATIALLGAFVVRNIYVVIFSMVFSIMFRNVYSEFLLARMIDYKCFGDVFWELFLAIVYLISLITLPGIFSWILFAVVYFAYLIFHRGDIGNIWRDVLRK